MKDEREDLKNLVHLLGHDVRNSVRALIEIPKWIKEDVDASRVTLPAETHEHLHLLTTQAARLDKMIEDLLAFAKYEKDDNRVPLPLRETIEEVVAGLNLPKGFSVRHDLQCSHVAIGQNDFQTVVSELLRNAVKHHHAEAGQIDIVAQTSDTTFEMTVADDGPGFPDKHQEKIFLPMKTLRPRDEVEGTGMGLSIARRIIKAYGGTLIVCASSNGSTFRISIPLDESRARLVG